MLSPCRPPPAAARPCSRKSVNTTVVASSKKIDISKQGLNSVENETVKLNLMGKSKSMESKDWVDPQGRKGKVRARAAEAAAECGVATHAAIPVQLPCTHRDAHHTSTTPVVCAAGLRRVPVRQQVRRQRGRLQPDLHP